MVKRFTAVLAAVCALGIFSTVAQAETTGPVWKVLSVSAPTNFKPGDHTGADALMVTATNVGGASTDGSAITIADAVPAGLTAVEILGNNPYHNPVSEVNFGEGLSCTLSPTTPSCTTSEKIDPGDTLIVTIRVHVDTDVEGSGEVNHVSVSGGGAATASLGNPVTISSASPAYGVAPGGLMAAASTSQAGAHPNVTSEFFLNTDDPAGEAHGEACGGVSPAFCTLESGPVSLPKDIGFTLPPGLVGTTVGMPRCTMADVVNSANCPQNTMVGAAILIVSNEGQRIMFTVPVYNIAPAPGEPAAFAFNALFFPVRLDTSVLSNGEYNVRITAPDITAGAATYFNSITIWGVPAEHNGPGDDAGARTLAGGECPGGSTGCHPQITFGGVGIEKYNTGEFNEEAVFDKRVPLLTNPSQCSTPLTGVLETDTWDAPGVFAKEEASMGIGTGCGQLSFKPAVSMLPDTLEAGAPAGYTFDLSLPQDTEAQALATPDVQRTSVTLPLGTVISPSAADGLGDCTSEQFDLHSGVPGACPRNSQVGTVRSKTPALEEALTGEIYLAAPECTGAGGSCTPADAQGGRMVRLFMQLVGEGESGIIVKQELTGQINQQTGQLTVIDDEVPQVPFSDLKLTLQGGERATLSNPRTCGEVTTTADLTAWSAPFTADGTPTSSFDVDENCFGPQFNPSFMAGTPSNQAGGFSPFTVSFGRSDSDEFLNGLQVQMPPGLLGMLSTVSLCGEAQAAQGTCGPESLIGETTVETGPGADPFLVTGGKIYITGPYKGAPYGLSIVVPAKAGPYTLSGTTGNGTVVVRAAISVDRITSALTVTADALPTELDGIPLQLRLVNVTINRPGFIFNPTDCNPMAIGATLTSTQAASASDSSSFQVTNCGSLKFKPSLAVSTAGKASKANGASLFFKIAYPAGAVGSQSWFQEAKFDLPKQLPARLTTLQKACLASVFEANPTACPSASRIGYATVHTPVLSVPLEGPVYFVSYGGAKFPEAVVVLQGDGVTVDLHGETFISQAGITSATFKNTPDVPFESIEVSIPTGPYSEFGANLPNSAKYSFCGRKLVMPTLLKAQDGTEIHQNTPIKITGCPTAKTSANKKASKARSARKPGHDQGGRS